MNLSMSNTWKGNVSNISLGTFSPGSSSWSYVDLLWTLAFSVIVITSIVGNCLVIWIVTGQSNLLLSSTTLFL